MASASQPAGLAALAALQNEAPQDTWLQLEDDHTLTIGLRRNLLRYRTFFWLGAVAMPLVAAVNIGLDFYTNGFDHFPPTRIGNIIAMLLLPAVVGLVLTQRRLVLRQTPDGLEIRKGFPLLQRKQFVPWSQLQGLIENERVQYSMHTMSQLALQQQGRAALTLPFLPLAQAQFVSKAFQRLIEQSAGGSASGAASAESGAHA
jgi:hypothetical protein